MEMRLKPLSVVAVLCVLGGCSLSSAAPAARLHGTKLTSARSSSTHSRTAVASPPPTSLPPPANPRQPGSVVTPGSNMPDPFVLVTRAGYYMYSSQTGFTTPPVSVTFSRDLDRWPAPQAAMSVVPPWAMDGFTWAPDVRFIDGRYVLYFDAWAVPAMFYEPWLDDLGSHAQCIGTATSSSPLGPFHPQATPLVCMFGHHGAIDPRAFLAPDGVLWLDWKSDDNANFPTATAVTHLFAQRLSRNGLGFVGRRYQLLQADRPWENRLVEAPDMVYYKGSYWLFFSGDWFDSAGYAIGVARCAGPSGPCVDWNRPFLASNAEGEGPGEESLFVDDSGRSWMVYSVWFDGYLGRHYRPIALARIAFRAAGPYLAAS
jgi:beta-xylosidase